MPGPGEIWRPVPWIAGFAAAAAALAVAAFVHVRPPAPVALASAPVAASRPVAAYVAPPPEESPPAPVEAPSLAPAVVDIDSLPAPAPVASAKRSYGTAKPKANEIVRTVDF
jgi:hypothetical protein